MMNFNFQFVIICLLTGRSMSRACNVIPCPGKFIPMTTSIFAASFLQTLKYNVYEQYAVIGYLLKPIITNIY